MLQIVNYPASQETPADWKFVRNNFSLERSQTSNQFDWEILRSETMFSENVQILRYLSSPIVVQQRLKHFRLDESTTFIGARFLCIFKIVISKSSFPKPQRMERRKFEMTD